MNRPLITLHGRNIFQFNESPLSNEFRCENKDSRLCEMTRLRLPVPPGFVIAADACLEFKYLEGEYHASMENVVVAIQNLESITNRIYGGGGALSNKPPLLVAVRPCSSTTFPGMMGTLLSVGMNDLVLQRLKEASGMDEIFALDVYRQFLVTFGINVMKIDKCVYDDIAADVLATQPLSHEYTSFSIPSLDPNSKETTLSLSSLRELVAKFRAIVDIPDDPLLQLRLAISAMVASWERHRTGNHFLKLQEDRGGELTIVVQRMVFGNRNQNSGSGVVFSRNPFTGDHSLFGVFRPGRMCAGASDHDIMTEEELISRLVKIDPNLQVRMQSITQTLEKRFSGIQEVSFAIEDGMLFVLQCQSPRASPKANLKVPVDMVAEKILSEQVAIARVDVSTLTHFMRPMADLSCIVHSPTHEEMEVEGAPHELLLATQNDFKSEISAEPFHDTYLNISGKGQFATVIGYGTASCPGCASGLAVFSEIDVKVVAGNGQQVIWFKAPHRATNSSEKETMSSHHQQSEKTCLGLVSGIVTEREDIGRSGLSIDGPTECLRMNGVECIRKYQLVSIDAASGMICNDTTLYELVVLFGLGTCLIMTRRVLHDILLGSDVDFNLLMKWCGMYKRMDVLANADSVSEVAMAIASGADGIGRCRADRFFASEDKRDLLCGFLLAERKESRDRLLDKMYEYLQSQFLQIFRIVDGRGVAVQLLNIMSVRAFLPQPSDQQGVRNLADRLSLTFSRCMYLLEQITYEEVYQLRVSMLATELMEMAVAATLGAALTAKSESFFVQLQFLIPVGLLDSQVDWAARIINQTAAREFRRLGSTVPYSLGVIVETPRAMVMAPSLASKEGISLVCFSTDKLTELVNGMTSKDCISELSLNRQRGIAFTNPFDSIDEEGLGRLMRTTLSVLREQHGVTVAVGMSGSHAADPWSARFLDSIGLDYVSCAADSVPMARLAAAQARSFTQFKKK